MAITGGIEVTDAYLDLPPEGEHRVLVAAARALRRRASTFGSVHEALAALGFRSSGTVLDGCGVQLDESVDLTDGKLFKALAAGVTDGFLLIWDARRQTRDVMRVNFDGSGRYKVHYLVWNGGDGCVGCLYEHA